MKGDSNDHFYKEHVCKKERVAIAGAGGCLSALPKHHAAGHYRADGKFRRQQDAV
jgi:hypothetical protein